MSKLIPIDVIRFDSKKFYLGDQCWILFLYITIFIYRLNDNRDTTKNHNKLIYRCDIYIYVLKTGLEKKQTRRVIFEKMSQFHTHFFTEELVYRYYICLTEIETETLMDQQS